jgi:hypothetical protein
MLEKKSKETLKAQRRSCNGKILKQVARCYHSETRKDTSANDICRKCMKL